MPRPLTKIRPSSLNVDRPASDVAPNEYTRGQNIQFRDGYAARSLGWAEIFPVISEAGFEAQHILNVQNNGVNYWLVGCNDGIVVTNTATWQDITPAGFTTGKTPEQWSSCLLNGIPIMNYQEDSPVYWDFDFATPTVMQALPGFSDEADDCLAVASSKNHLFALGPDEGSGTLESKVLWSDAAPAGSVPGTWSAAAGNEAGDLVLADTRDPVRAGLNLRGQLAVYKQNSTYLLTYIGGTFIWDSRLLFSNSGILSNNSVVAIPGGRHCMLTDGDVIQHDGQISRSIVNQRWKRTIFSLIDPTYYERAFAVHDQRNTEVLFCIPENGNEYPNIAIAWNYEEDKIGIRDLNPSSHGASGIVTETGYNPAWSAQTIPWQDYAGVWGQTYYNPADDGVLLCEPDAGAGEGQLYYLDGATDQNGTDHTSTVAKEMMDFEAPGSRKLVTGIWPRVVAQVGSTLRVRVGTADLPDSTISWGSYVEFDPDVSDFVAYMAEGRYLSFEFSSTSGNQWKLIGFDVEAEILGQY